MQKLIAKYPILYLSKQYEVGEELIANDPDMVKAWIDAETAEWVDDEGIESDGTADSVVEAEVVSPPKAIPMSAEAGLVGDEVGAETDENLVGRVPKTTARARK